MVQSQNLASFTERQQVSLLGRIVGAQSPFQVRDALLGYLFLSPWLAGLVLFFGGPIIASALLSLADYDVVSTPIFVGLENYERAFVKDDLVWDSLLRTIYYTLAVVPITLSGSLLLAILLNQSLTGTNLFRTFFFLPHLTPAVAMAVLWLWLLHPQLGPVNAFLGSLGLPKPGWLASRTWAIPSMILISSWAGMGGNSMLIFLAALQGVPTELYEAAEIDGGGIAAKFRHITLPMISPTIFFNLLLGIIGALKVFTLAFVATEGGPSYATWFYALHVYNQAFKYFRLGYGSALAWIFAVIVISLTVIQVRLSRHWVYYMGE